MPNATNTTQLQSAFDTATKLNFPHYSVQLPKWEKGEGSPNLEDNITDEPMFTPGKHPLTCVALLAPRINKLRMIFPGDLDDVTTGRSLEPGPNKEKAPELSRMPHPGSNFDHVHPHKSKAGRDAPVPAGLQRLKLVFEWVLCQVTTLFGEINAALDNDDQNEGQAAYEKTRKKYIDLLRDLDDHEPRGMLKPGMNGYGRAVKWAYILPLIHEGRIKGVKVVAKWNPHISSSGIPIPHA